MENKDIMAFFSSLFLNSRPTLTPHTSDTVNSNVRGIQNDEKFSKTLCLIPNWLGYNIFTEICVKTYDMILNGAQI